jgi:hypothetical protein
MSPSAEAHRNRCQLVGRLREGVVAGRPTAPGAKAPGLAAFSPGRSDATDYGVVPRTLPGAPWGKITRVPSLRIAQDDAADELLSIGDNRVALG